MRKRIRRQIKRGKKVKEELDAQKLKRGDRHGHLVLNFGREKKGRGCCRSLGGRSKRAGKRQKLAPGRGVADCKHVGGNTCPKKEEIKRGKKKKRFQNKRESIPTSYQVKELGGGGRGKKTQRLIREAKLRIKWGAKMFASNEPKLIRVKRRGESLPGSSTTKAEKGRRSEGIDPEAWRK